MTVDLGSSASTTPTDVDTSIPELWAKNVLREHLREGFWGRFIGTAIKQQTELLGAGDILHIQVTNPLAGSGVSGDTALLQGNEENLTSSEIKCMPKLLRHGVRTYRRAAKKSILDLRGEARSRLAEWGAEAMDDKRFMNFGSVALDGTASFGGNHGGETYAPNVYVAGGGTDEDDVEVGDDLGVEEVQEIALKLYEQKAKPVVIDGQEYFALVVSPRALHALKREAEYRDWVREAHVRGPENPFFRGATAVIDGVVIYRHTNVLQASDAGAGGNVPYMKGIAFGAEAFVEAVDESPTWAEEMFDYGNEMGVAYGFAFEPRRALELSSVQVYASNPNPF
jgi:N4-gp56 family major capsid protein